MGKKIARFEFNDILPIGLTIVVTGIGVAYGLNVMGDTRDDLVKDEALTFTCNSTLNGGTGNDLSGCTNPAINATSDSITGVAKLPEKLPLIVNVIVAAIVIGILVRYLMVRFG